MQGLRRQQLLHACTATGGTAQLVQAVRRQQFLLRARDIRSGSRPCEELYSRPCTGAVCKPATMFCISEPKARFEPSLRREHDNRPCSCPPSRAATISGASAAAFCLPTVSATGMTARPTISQAALANPSPAHVAPLWLKELAAKDPRSTGVPDDVEDEDDGAEEGGE